MTELIHNSAAQGFRLSRQQKQIWTLQQAGAGQPFRGLCQIRIEGKLREDVLRRALESLVNRHEILRTRFTRVAGIKTPFQIVAETPQFSWVVLDLSSLTAAEQDRRIAEHFDHECEQPFAFDQGPLLRVTLIKQSEDGHVLLALLPALCADSVALVNFTDELSQVYAAGLNPQRLAGEPLQYADFAEWQNELLEGTEEHAATGKDYWRNVDAASGLPPALLRERRDGGTGSFVADSIAVDLDSTLQQIAAIASKYEAPVSAVLFAAWHALLWRLSGQSESAFLLHSLCTGRKFADLQSALGVYAKYLPILLGCEDKSFVEHLRRVSNALNEADEWQEYFDPGEPANASANSVAFDFEERQTRYDAGLLSFCEMRRYVCFSPFKLKLSCVLSRQAISAELHYNTQVVDSDAANQIADYFQRFLSGVLQNAEADIAGIEILSTDERHRLLVEFNQTAADLPGEKCIHQLFEEQVVRTPQAVAVVSGVEELTYDELNRRANQLAHLLRSHGIGPDACVGLCVERSVEMIVGLMGVVKAGAAYVPLNPDHPRDRLALQLAESNASIVIVKNEESTQTFAASETLDLGRDRALLEAQPNTNPAPSTRPDNLVYVIYTSGSTGTPKGVAVRHLNLTNYTQFILQRLQINSALNFATVSTISADLGNTCIFPALVSGGCLHVIGYDVAMEGDLLRDYFTRRPIDVLKIVPSHFSALLASQTDGRILPAKYLILGGEALSWDLVERIRVMDHTCQIINHYGPTETTVGSLTFSVDTENLSRHSSTVPIGRPIANTRCYVLDKHLRPAPLGISGELYIGGAGVSAGYLNQAAETAARFVSDPFSSDPESRLYRTGDLARYLPDGNIEFLGRADTQVKVRGYRVELGEIEAVLSRRAGVRQVVVTVFRDKSAGERVVAYMVSSPVSPDELRASLKEKLPDYMVPSAFVFLKSLPLTPNGKVDRNALPAPDETRPGLQSDFVAPRSLIEKELAGIWASFLKVSVVGVHDNFFDLGGHSLLATQVVSRMRKEFQQEIPLRSLFESPTVAQLAEKIEEANSNEAERFLNEIEALSEEDAKQLLGQESSTSG